MTEYRRYYKLQRYNKDGTPYEPPMYKKGYSIEQHWWPSLESCEVNQQAEWVLLNDEYICEKTENDTYISYQKLQKVIDGVPYQPEEFKKGDRVGDVEYNSLESCEQQIYRPKNCFSWIPSSQHVSMTLNGVNYDIDNAYYNGYCFTDDIQTLKFEATQSNQYPETINFVSISTENCTDLSRLFSDQTKLISVDLSLFRTSKVENMERMFMSCKSLTSVNLSSFDTSSVLKMNSMFYHCDALTNLDLSSFTNKTTTNMMSMFSYCGSLTDLNISKFTPLNNVNNASNMFYSSSKINHITCTQAFKNWCISNQDKIVLPTAMRNGGSGTWTIVG